MKNKNLFNLQLGLALFALVLILLTFAIKKNELLLISERITSIMVSLLSISSGLLIGAIMKYTLAEKDVKDKKTATVQCDENVGSKITDDDTNISSQETGLDVVNTQKDISVNILDVHTAFLKIEERLLDEIKAVGKRANLNLIIGSVVALIGWGLLFWFVCDVSDMELEGWKLLNAFLPRLSIIIIIEMFSYFFLKLYRESIDRIRYYQNELTNIETKKMAILISCMLENNNEHKKSLIENLISVERNVFLKKGETTIELEKIRMDNSFSNSVIKSIKDLGLGFAPTSTK